MVDVVQLSASLKRKLEALNCDVSDVVLTAGQPTKFCDLVVWLEDTKIRLWGQKKREALKKFSDGKQWVSTFAKYLDALGVKTGDNLINIINRDAKFQHALIDRLASLAVEDQYLDKVKHFTEPMEGQTMKRKQPASSTTELIPPLNGCLDLFDLPTLPLNAPAHQLLAAFKCILERIAQTNQHEGPSRLEAMNLLKTCPSGINVSGHSEQLQTLLRILRLINIHDLRDTQEVINKSISRLQEVTGDPKTDNALYGAGK